MNILLEKRGEKYIKRVYFSASMGNIRPSNIKRVARELVNKHGEMFNGDFDHNKKVVEELTDVQTKKLRNTLAGYVTRYWRIKKRKEEGS